MQMYFLRIFSTAAYTGYVSVLTGENEMLKAYVICKRIFRLDGALPPSGGTFGAVDLIRPGSLNLYFAISETGYVLCREVVILANFNKDELSVSLSIEPTANMRVELRNENGVLICDNGMPLPDGTYPPDAKNRADLAGMHAAPAVINSELAGMHAAPAVINSELETALMGDETNKERVQE